MLVSSVPLSETTVTSLPRRWVSASKFSDAQKAFILKQGDDGVPVGRPAGRRDQPGDLFQLEEKVLWSAAGRDASTASPGGREREAEEDRC
mgnify:CR=1 FL=1